MARRRILAGGSSDEEHPRSVVSLLQELCERIPDARLFTFVNENGEDCDTLTAGELAAAANGIARALRSWGVIAGDRAVLVYPPSLDFVKAFLGCLVAGVIPVPVCPPSPVRWARDIVALSKIVANTDAQVALTNSEYDEVRAAQSEDVCPVIPWRRTDQCRPGPAALPDLPTPAMLDTPAFLQYTSGSTGTPKGVIVTHRNLWHELRANARDLHLDADTTGVFWVPHFHDLGLICVILNTVVGNAFNTRLLSPLAFLRRPAIWADVMSRVCATHTAAPNFAYELLVRKTTAEQRRGWDLSSLRVAALAGEPVRPATVRAFRDAFAASKFPPKAIFSTYGLAECTVTVAMGGRTELTVDRRELDAGRVVPLAAGTGRPAATFFSAGRVTKSGASVRIVDPDTARPCLAGQVGEIWVDAPTKAAGYWAMWEESAELFRARVAGDENGREYLRTGDLGFCFRGELYVIGRRKDLIIMHGHNLYPQDIEDSVREAHSLIRPGGLAAFSVPGDDTEGPGERVVLFVEVSAAAGETEYEEIVRAVRRRVSDDHQIACHAVVLGTAGTVRKTTSGKVRRRDCRAAFLSGEIDKAVETIGVFLQPGSVPLQREAAR